MGYDKIVQIATSECHSGHGYVYTLLLLTQSGRVYIETQAGNGFEEIKYPEGTDPREARP